VSSFFIYGGSAAFALGIFVRSFLALSLPTLGAFCVTAFGVWLIVQRNTKTDISKKVFGAALFIMLFALGALRMDVATWYEVAPDLEARLDEQVTLEGIVEREPDIRASSQNLYVRVDEELLLVKVDRYKEVDYGDKVSFTGTLTLPEPFETDLGRTFNYPGYLQARGVHYVVSFARLTVVESGQGYAILTHLLQVKHALMSRIEAVVPEPEVGLAEGLLLGVQQALGKDIEAAFRTTGVIHIVVLSGYNIMLVVTFVMYVLAFLVPFRMRLLFGTVAIILFACMVGLSATVVRASTMAVLALFAKSTGRTYAVVRALFVAGVLMLVYNPYLLVYDVGFQLSFIATLGLIVVTPLVSPHVRFMPKFVGLREFLTATLATQIFVTPILLYQMGQFSVVALVVNLLVLPMVPVSMLLTFITGIVGFLSTSLSVPIAYLTYLSLTYILYIVQFFAALPFASFVVPAFPFFVVVLWYLFYAFVLWYLQTKEKVSAKLSVSTDTETLVSWTLVDEDVYKQLLKNQQVSKLTTPSEVPIFFR
jgi:competence protein ComEC